MSDTGRRELVKDLGLRDHFWHQTFPHLLTPLPGEWLPGLLLRCDEANHWGSRTALACVLSAGPEKFHRCWRTPTPNLVVIQPFSLPLDSLAGYLALPTNVLLATTYHLELMRLYGSTQLHPKLLSASFTFHLCPTCLAEKRLLQRTLALPHLSLCHKHRIKLLAQCQCGASLQLFHQKNALPFTCHVCGLDWANLPRIEAPREQYVEEQKYLIWYEFFFSQGNPFLFRQAMRLASGLPMGRSKGEVARSENTGGLNRLVGEPFPLGMLVFMLVKRNVEPDQLR